MGSKVMARQMDRQTDMTENITFLASKSFLIPEKSYQHYQKYIDTSLLIFKKIMEIVQDILKHWNIFSSSLIFKGEGMGLPPPPPSLREAQVYWILSYPTVGPLHNNERRLRNAEHLMTP